MKRLPVKVFGLDRQVVHKGEVAVAVRIALMVVAVLFLCMGAVFLGIGLYQALLLAFQPWAAALMTGCGAIILGGLFALVGSHWSSRSSGSAYGGAALGAASASIGRAVESNPIVAIGAAALVGLVQALIFGRRR